MKRYRYLQADSYSKPVFKPTLMRAARRHLKGGEGGFALQITDHDPRQRLNRRQELRSIAQVARKLKINERVRVRNRDEKVVFQFQRITNLLFRQIETPGNDRIDAIHSFVFGTFPKAFSLGLFVCKHILGTSEYSQHAWFNAEDYGAGVPGMPALFTMADAVVKETETGTLRGQVDHVIVGDKVWTPSGGWVHYSGEYHYHVHVDGVPNYTGTPPCAR